MSLASSFIRDVLDWVAGAAHWLDDGRTWLDVGAAGLGIDFVGAWLLARALLLSPQEVFSRTHAQDNVFTSDDEERRLARDTLRAVLGVSLLGAGFACQLAALIANQAAEPPTPTTQRALVALLCAAVAVALGAGLSWLAIQLSYGRFLSKSEFTRKYLFRRRMQDLPRVGNSPGASASAQQPAPPASGPPQVAKQVVPDTVEALLENAKALADGEDARGASLKLRAGWLLGFLGVMLTILLTQARELPRADLGAIGTPVAGTSVIIALGFILASARLAVKTLSVVQLWHVEPAEAQKYPTNEYISEQPEDARGKMLHGWVRQFADERPANNIKATDLQKAFQRLLYGFFALAGLAITILARALGL